MADGFRPRGVESVCPGPGLCIGRRRTVLVAGGTGSGKTTLIEVLARVLPPAEPVLVLDDGEELNLDCPHRELILPHRFDELCGGPALPERASRTGRPGSRGTDPRRLAARPLPRTVWQACCRWTKRRNRWPRSRGTRSSTGRPSRLC
ncbi:MAG: hypothetical protein F4Y47_10955 [Acidobacteriia bacterium]|nr:hypothetical protein [Terriglobia bacterium]MYG01697.1 hypothetical protein [Terriglobia bacterium]MYK12182.1 hypothetical protein [Terriglobia bacterium]